MKVMNWELSREGKEWVAVAPESPNVTVRIRDREILLYDAENYYPSGQYSVPLAVIEALQSRAPR